MCSTVEPAFSVGLEKKLNVKGLLSIDAPLAGVDTPHHHIKHMNSNF
jgi:3-hydroxyisobutyrate dehydrogenase-like beta-hydroxyacid dehydrogenase